VMTGLPPSATFFVRTTIASTNASGYDSALGAIEPHFQGMC
jgi:hypothetical protein